MPKSRVRKRPTYVPPPRPARAKTSPPWLAPVMVACLVVGLAWIGVYYVTNDRVPGLSVLGPWNMAVGFALIIAGIALSTKWR